MLFGKTEDDFLCHIATATCTSHLHQPSPCQPLHLALPLPTPAHPGPPQPLPLLCGVCFRHELCGRKPGSAGGWSNGFRGVDSSWRPQNRAFRLRLVAETAGYLVAGGLLPGCRRAPSGCRQVPSGCRWAPSVCPRPRSLKLTVVTFWPSSPRSL